MKFTIPIPRESCTNAKAKYSSSVVPSDPSVHFYHWLDTTVSSIKRMNRSRCRLGRGLRWVARNRLLGGDPDPPGEGAMFVAPLRCDLTAQFFDHLLLVRVLTGRASRGRSVVVWSRLAESDGFEQHSAAKYHAHHDRRHRQPPAACNQFTAALCLQVRSHCATGSTTGWRKRFEYAINK